MSAHRSVTRPFGALAVGASALVFAACGRSEGSTKAESKGPSEERPAVTESGARITFAAGSPGLARFEVSEAHAGSTIVAVNAPAHVVATIAPTTANREPVILFESADATNAWSQYRQSRLLVDRTSRALERVREMFTNLGATAREVSEAENDLAAARAAAAEQEGRMRALGFDPATLASESTASAWLMADVPEADLREVQRDGTVRVELSAFPAQELVGRADAVGDIVDPVTRTVKVRVRIADPQRRILPGMFGRVAFGQPKNAVVVVPGSAVITVEQRDYVFVRTTAGEFLRQPVTTQRASADSVIILSGVKPGTQVVTSGAMLLKGLSFGY